MVELGWAVYREVKSVKGDREVEPGSRWRDVDEANDDDGRSSASSMTFSKDGIAHGSSASSIDDNASVADSNEDHVRA